MMFNPIPSYPTEGLLESIINNDCFHMAMMLAESRDVPAVLKLAEQRKADKEIVSRCKTVLDYMINKGRLTMKQLSEYDRLFVRGKE